MEKRGVSLWGTRRAVKKFIQKRFGVVGKSRLGGNWWKESGKVYTKKLFNFHRDLGSFPSYTQTSTATTNFIIE
jgi:hypothetical protein